MSGPDQGLSEPLRSPGATGRPIAVSDILLNSRPGYTRSVPSISRGCLVSMSQQSEERVSDQVSSDNPKARVIPFERPQQSEQSELQKAVQQRAQETMDRERARANRKAPVWRRGLVLALAAVPVFITFGAAVGFVGALRQFNTAVFEGSQTAPAGQAPATVAPPGEPGVVLLQSYDKSAAPTRGPAAPAVSPSPR